MNNRFDWAINILNSKNLCPILTPIFQYNSQTTNTGLAFTTINTITTFHHARLPSPLSRSDGSLAGSFYKLSRDTIDPGHGRGTSIIIFIGYRGFDIKGRYGRLHGMLSPFKTLPGKRQRRLATNERRDT